LYKLLFLFLFSIPLFAKTFTISSYNVENFFDLTYNGTEYKEYIPNTSSKWNKKTYKKKLDNIVKVLNTLNADIVALQEIENKNLLKQLQKKLPMYKYISFSKYKKSSVGIGFLSKISIIENDNIKVKFEDKLFRPILETTFKLEDKEFKIFNNHWPSKRASEKYRLKYAKKLFDRVNLLPKDYDYILIGDFNSNYNEYQTFKNDKKLNDTFSITGINQVLNTTLDKKFMTYDDIIKHKRKVHYNLWLDLNYNNRFSNKYRGQNETPDNILISPALFDDKNIF
jgi:predicted extracellular nuclease